MRFLIALCFLSLIVSRTSAQRIVTVYYDKELSGNGKVAVFEFAELIKRSGISVNVDSIRKFNGNGIYLAQVQSDRYKKYPGSLTKMGAEGFFIQGDRKGVYISANSDLGLQEAAFAYLRQLGYRFYFPDKAWHIIPQLQTACIEYTKLYSPSYQYRAINMSYGEGGAEIRNKHLFWQKANMLGGAFNISNHHAYYELIADKKKEFEKNPSFLSKPLLNGQRQAGATFNYSSPELAELAYQWLAGKFDAAEKAGRPLQMLSLEPFDGGEYCELPACKKISNNASDQVFYFTNIVARKLKKTHPGKMIGILAYNAHIDIPSFPIEDNIFVSLTGGFNQSAYSLDELAARWKKRAKIMGVYEYMNVYSWTHDLPGKGLAGDYRKVAKTLRKHYANGIRSFESESNYGWIGKGLGHYIAARVCWDVTENEDKIVKEFFDLCFPKTRTLISSIFNAWTTYTDQTPTDSDLAKWMTALKTAMQQCDEINESGRLEQIALYLEYIRKFKIFNSAKGAALKEKADQFYAYTWKILNTSVAASVAALNEGPINYGAEYDYHSPNAPYKKIPAYVPRGKAEWQQYFAEILPGMKMIDERLAFPESKKISLSTIKPFSTQLNWVNDKKEMTFSYKAKIIVDLTKSDSAFVRVKIGRISQAGSATLDVYAWDDSLLPTGIPIKTFTFRPADNTIKADLSSLKKSRYILVYSDEGSGANIYFPEKLKYSIVVSAASPMIAGAYNQFYFYVPPGTKRFYIFRNGHFRISKPGKKVVEDREDADPIEFAVDEQETGWWLGSNQLQNFYFVGIPPLISRSAESFFFP